eukprot:CAMPEP_0118941252 /NCGR_PEP_ID=MMETSP1169-20130426/33425_1 /TAXON_ID=36882 /ORGANISM="Pyramimonas obovata, Strain CCMP722" /LENGTH=88 /DNA_ID=CAMNT_0006885953 /DNA_START=477 /DNA_END=743 /DNA_ORIENTATION=+
MDTAIAIESKTATGVEASVVTVSVTVCTAVAASGKAKYADIMPKATHLRREEACVLEEAVPPTGGNLHEGLTGTPFDTMLHGSRTLND